MHRPMLAVFAVLLLAGWLAGCNSATPTPAPTSDVLGDIQTETASMNATTEAKNANTANVEATTAAKLEASRPTDPPTPRLAPTPDVPSDPDAFAKYVIANYGKIGDADLSANGQYMWLDSMPNTLRIELDKGLFALKLGDVGNEVKDEWGRNLARDMEAFAKGDEWSVSFVHNRVETNAAQAGRDTVEWKDWFFISDEYDADVGGFAVSETPASVTKASGNSVFVRAFPLKYDLPLSVILRPYTQ